MARVTGIGGVFLKARDPKALAAWYAEHLGLHLSPWGGAKLLWSDEVPAGTGMTTWSLFPADTQHFGPGPQTAMINYRVDDLDALLAALPASLLEPRREDSPTAGSPGSPTRKAISLSFGNPFPKPQKNLWKICQAVYFINRLL